MRKIFYFAKILILIFYFGFSNTVFAASSSISALIFTTDLQTVLPGAISSEINVQAQNSSGTAEKVDETNDVTFTTTSATGEFFNSSGNPVSTTMSKNTSSRTFYYRDSTEGIYTITFLIKGRDTGKTFSATQKITISSKGNQDDASSTQTSTSTDSTNSSSSSSSSQTNSTISSHSSDVPLTSLKEDIELRIDAGRKRLSIINSPITFKAKSEQSGFSGDAFYEWTFGDGGHEYGKSVSHAYLFSGSYNVVLNASHGDAHAVSRTQVSIIDPLISVSEGSLNGKDFVEVKNNSKAEINLQGFRLSGDGLDILIPIDTILAQGGSLKFPIASKEQGEIILEYPNKEVVSKIISNSFAKNIEEIGEIENKIALLTREIADKYKAEDLENSKKQISFDAEKQKSDSDKYFSSTTVIDNKSTTTEAIYDKTVFLESLEGSKKKDFVESLLASPKRLLEFIIRR